MLGDPELTQLCDPRDFDDGLLMSMTNVARLRFANQH
jgi:hypothetical protein